MTSMKSEENDILKFVESLNCFKGFIFDFQEIDDERAAKSGKLIEAKYQNDEMLLEIIFDTMTFSFPYALYRTYRNELLIKFIIGGEFSNDVVLKVSGIPLPEISSNHVLGIT